MSNIQQPDRHGRIGFNTRLTPATLKRLRHASIDTSREIQELVETAIIAYLDSLNLDYQSSKCQTIVINS